MDEREAFLTALQMGDSFFPSGAFAHSSGLETFTADGLVADRQGLVRFIESCLVGLTARCDLLFVKLSHAAAAGDRPDEVIRLDRLIHAMKCPAELRAASVQMGRQVLTVMDGLCPSSFTGLLRKRLEAREINGHHAVMFGAVCGSAGIAARNAMLTYLYSTVSSLVSAGVRLIPIGHGDGQAAIGGLIPLVARLAEQAERLGEEDISSFAPAIEVRSMRHEHLQTRLFKS
jgi:urease accessory protein